MKYPFTDDYMIYDHKTHRYTLTEKDVEETLGINLSLRNENPIVRNALLKTISNHVYNYIHSHNIDNLAQDYVIAKTKSGREIIKEAMENQLIYVLNVGDLSRVADVNLKPLWFDEQAKETLFRIIPEIGSSICYCGRFYINTPEGDW